jgi:hypothetical protein
VIVAVIVPQPTCGWVREVTLKVPKPVAAAKRLVPPVISKDAVSSPTLGSSVKQNVSEVVET